MVRQRQSVYYLAVTLSKIRAWVTLGCTYMGKYSTHISVSIMIIITSACDTLRVIFAIKILSPFSCLSLRSYSTCWSFHATLCSLYFSRYVSKLQLFVYLCMYHISFHHHNLDSPHFTLPPSLSPSFNKYYFSPHRHHYLYSMQRTRPKRSLQSMERKLSHWRWSQLWQRERHAAISISKEQGNEEK